MEYIKMTYQKINILHKEFNKIVLSFISLCQKIIKIRQ